MKYWSVCMLFRDQNVRKKRYFPTMPKEHQQDAAFDRFRFHNTQFAKVSIDIFAFPFKEVDWHIQFIEIENWSQSNKLIVQYEICVVCKAIHKKCGRIMHFWKLIFSLVGVYRCFKSHRKTFLDNIHKQWVSEWVSAWRTYTALIDR